MEDLSQQSQTVDNTRVYSVFSINARDKAIIVDISLDGHSTTMEVDTGVSVSVMSEITFCKLFGDGVT